MIELEIQGLSPSRDGLLIEVGRFAMANGFTLQRQRLVQDPHGILLTMVVHGPSRGRKKLEAALGAYERFISFQIFPFVDGELKPHFAASLPPMAYTLPPAPPVAAPVEPTINASADTSAKINEAPVDAPASPAGPEFEFIQPTPRPPAPASAAVAVLPFVDVVPLAADEPAVKKMLSALEYDYPKIVPQLLVLQQSVAEAARESSLTLAGKRTGNWVYQRDYLLDDGLDLREAIERIGVPALRAMVEIDQQDTLLHIHNSPLCSQDGHSGCSFFGGFLEGLLGPAVAPGSLSIFPVCCRSYGADACVMAISD